MLERGRVSSVFVVVASVIADGIVVASASIVDDDVGALVALAGH